MFWKINSHYCTARQEALAGGCTSATGLPRRTESEQEHRTSETAMEEEKLTSLLTWPSLLLLVSAATAFTADSTKKLINTQTKPL